MITKTFIENNKTIRESAIHHKLRGRDITLITQYTIGYVVRITGLVFLEESFRTYEEAAAHLKQVLPEDASVAESPVADCKEFYVADECQYALVEECWGVYRNLWYDMPIAQYLKSQGLLV